MPKKRPQKPSEKLREQLLASAGLNPKRNNALFDKWSIVHLVTGVGMGWLMAPVVALIIMVAWEPLEILLLSPLLARLGVVFGFEAFVNSLSDIFFDAVGVVIGAYVLTVVVSPPFHIF